MAKILIVYRDNVLFREYVPEVTKSFPNIQIKTFPDGTNGEEIKGWINENEKMFKSKVITDQTVGSQISYDCRERLKLSGCEFAGKNLDTMMREAMNRSFFKERYDMVFESGAVNNAWTTDREDYVRTLSVITKSVLDGNSNPQNVILFKDNIKDHPWGRGHGSDKLSELHRTIKNETDEDIRSKITQEIEGEIVKAVMEGLVAGGILSQKIRVDKIDDDKRKLKELDKPNYWIIVDRHYRSMNTSLMSFKHAKFLRLPHDSLLKSLHDANMIIIDRNDVCERLKKMLLDIEIAV